MSYRSLLLSLSPTHSYRLAESSGITATDDVGGSNGTYTPNSGGSWTGGTLAQTGALLGDSDKAALFNGSTGLVDCGTAAQFGTGDFTVILWVKIASWQDFMGPAGNWNGSGGFIFYIHNPSSNIVPHVQVAGTNYMGVASLGTSGSPDTNWHMLAVTRIGGAVTLYFDGTATASGTGNNGSASSGAFQIGNWGTGGSQEWNGLIDEVALFTTGLIAQNIADLYTAGTTSALSAGILSASSHDDASATLSLATNSGGTSPYSSQLQVAPDVSGSPGSWSNTGSPVGGATPTLTATGLTASTTYWFRAVVTDNASATANSNSVSVTTDAPTIPSTPTNPSVFWRGNGSLTVNWDAMLHATAYKLYRGTSSNGEGGSPVATPSAPPYTDTGLTNGTTYYYKIKATNAGGDSSASSEISGAPAANFAPNVLSSRLSACKTAAEANSTAWQTFKTHLDSGDGNNYRGLNSVITYGYQASEMSWISDYALGAYALRDANPTAAQHYADKAIGLMNYAATAYLTGKFRTQTHADGGAGTENGFKYIGRGDGSTTAFTLADAPSPTGSFGVYTGTRTVLTMTKGAAGGKDLIGFGYQIIKISNSNDGTADYARGADWQTGGNVSPSQIDWSLAGSEPSVGATYYVTTIIWGDLTRLTTGYTLSGTTLTFTSAPGANTVVYADYLYGTHATDFSTLAYQQTSNGDGGYISYETDTTYSLRYLAKHMGMGRDWLAGYGGMTSVRAAVFDDLILRWSQNFTSGDANLAYQSDCPGSNYGIGAYISAAFGAAALATRDLTNGATLLSAVSAYRDATVLTFLTQADNGLADQTATLKGGFWLEGENYGALASQNLVLGGAVLVGAGGIANADAEAAWASDCIRQKLIGSPDATSTSVYPTQTVDVGDGYAYPMPFIAPPNGLFNVLQFYADDSAASGYARTLSGLMSSHNDDWSDFMFGSVTAGGDWTGTLPKAWRASGGEVIVGRTDFGTSNVWWNTVLGNVYNAGHQAVSTGLIELRRARSGGVDDLLVYGPAVSGEQDFQDKSVGANTLIVDDGGAGAQNYRFSPGVWHGSPGCTVTSYDAQTDYLFVAADLKPSYSLNTNPGGGGSLSEWVRSQLFYRKSTGEAYLIVHDRATTTNSAYTKTARWHALNGTSTLSGGIWSVASGSSKAFVKPLSPVSLTVTAGTLTQNAVAMDELQVVNTSAATRTRYVHAIHAGASSLSGMDASVYVAGTELEGVLIGNVCAMFRHTATAFSGTDTYAITATNGATITHYVTGLAANTRHDLVGTVESFATTTSAGVLTFTSTGTGSSQAVSLTATVATHTPITVSVGLIPVDDPSAATVDFATHGGGNLTGVDASKFRLYRDGVVDPDVTVTQPSGLALTFTPDVPFTDGEVVTLAGDVGAVTDANGDPLQAFTNFAITNATDTTAPTRRSITASGTTITITYNEALDTGSVPAAGDFTHSSKTISGVSVVGATVRLTVTVAFASGASAGTLTYTPGTDKVQDLAGNDAPSFSTQTVTLARAVSSTMSLALAIGLGGE
jgi:hypothetical protein